MSSYFSDKGCSHPFSLISFWEPKGGIMNKFEQYVERVRTEQLRNNIAPLRQQIKQSWAQKKIINWAARYGYDKEEVEQKILEDDMFASCFAKDPIKQNYTEKIAEQLLGVKHLPNNGISFSKEGELCNGCFSDNSKSVDFIRDNTYITQKYTRGNGGAQDNQYRDVIQFLTYGSKQHKVAAYIDGSYYTDEKRSELKKLFADNPNVQICSLGDLYEN